MINKYYCSKEYDNTTMSELAKHPENYMELINKYTISPLEPEKVFAFSVVLCDNDVDRDGEKFTVDSLKILEEKFVGKTGIFDHNPQSRNQIARIVKTAVEKVPNRYTKDGEEYHQLSALVYTLNNESNKEFIENIKGGILKEVSVGCAIEDTSCSICGEHDRTCEHINGEYYNNKLACTYLNNPTDAYEFSFVAIPAQVNAGVTKRYEKESDKKNMENEDVVKSYIEKKFADYKIEFKTIEELMKSYNEIKNENIQLSEKAKQYDSYKHELIEEALANGVKAEGDNFKSELYRKAFETFPCEDIKGMSDSWKEKAMERLNAGKQVSTVSDFGLDNKNIDFTQYKF